MVDQLQVRAGDELTLDAGTVEKVVGPHGPELLIRPPEATLFHQVLAYLQAKPDPPKPPSGSLVGREGVAAAAVVLRWGSYLAVALDRNKPIWTEAHAASTSRLSDDEMARINIEASAGLAEWIDISRSDGRGYLRLVDRAVSYLPMANKRSKLEITEFAALAEPDLAARVIQASDATRVERVRGQAEHTASRLFANAVVNTAWRNGPVENIHAGTFRGYPLDQRRMTPAEERELMVFASGRLALGMAVCLQLTTERSRRTWPEQVLPYGLAELMLITPSRWSLTEASREIRLPAPCP
ncbi:MAG: hypothetical protein AB1486_05960 [Planctomycetota bacterium]